MAQTKTKNGNSKPTPDLLGTLGKRGPGRPKKQPTRNASQIADSLETEAKRLQGAADILRGKV